MIKVTRELSIPAVANKRYANLSIKETKGRVIGGDRADLRFHGFHIDGDKTVLDNPELVRVDLEDFDDQEQADDYAEEILLASFASIGAETIEHS